MKKVSGVHDFLRLDFSLWRQRHGLLKFDEEKVFMRYARIHNAEYTLH